MDSNEMSFKMAGILAIRNVSPNCKPALFEPIHADEQVPPEVAHKVVETRKKEMEEAKAS